MGFVTHNRHPNSRGIPVALRSGAARYVYWGGFIDASEARDLPRVKLAVMAYSECDMMIRWSFLNPCQYAVGVLAEGSMTMVFAPVIHGLPIIRSTNGDRLISDRSSPVYSRHGF